MKIIKKLAKYLILTLVILIIASPLWLRVVPTKYITLITGKVGFIDRVVCNFSTKVSGQSMNPLIAPGSSVEINRCFEDGDLTEGTAILFNDGSNLRIGIIRHILPFNPVVYKVSDEKAPELFHDVIAEEITGVAEGVDTSKSKYEAKQGVNAFVLEANDYLADFYLAKIPRGSGVEASTSQKTTSFSKEEDKFCFVVIPKKSLTNVSLEVVNTGTQKTTVLGSGIVFDVRQTPNINCQDFGSGQGMFNLDFGTYRYRLLVNHQALADIQFEVR